MQQDLFNEFNKKKKEDDDDFYEEKIDEDGNIIDEETSEEIDINKLEAPTVQAKKTTTWKASSRSTIRSATSTDCAYREGPYCTKTNKRISLDAREEMRGRTKDHMACWERMFCDNYKKLGG